MKTLYVEKVPDELYAAIRARAQENRSSMAAEVLAVLAQQFPTETERRRRREAMKRLLAIRDRPPRRPGRFPSAEQLVREMRDAH